MSVSVAENVTASEPTFENHNNITVNNIVTRDIQLEDVEQTEEPSIQEYVKTPYPSTALWTVPVLRKIINAINNAYFNAKLIDNIIMYDDLKSILETVANKTVEIALEDLEPSCQRCEKLAVIRNIAKITVIDNGVSQNFKYAYNDVYEALINDFHINMNRCFIAA